MNMTPRAIAALLLACTTLAAHADNRAYRDTVLGHLEFTSPSKNIRCRGDEPTDPTADFKGFNGVTCSVYRDNATIPELPHPKGCPTDSLTVFTLHSTGKSAREAECSGDPYYTFHRPVKALPYGETLRGNGWQCSSSTNGIRCENKSGHGFELNQHRQRLF
ncbi:Uncharacterised protein [Kingella denitrificans]|uniref:Uncharacterized protein n=1 Tax=Kingella denitrificans ATCC 33394 TaxID=888741 RepID=F0F2C8_9NEIS|nr:DUF6636 domain-containing protein [Kingella denitrificans]EGC16428.1 hypothetical protein HMPREF9098_2263 [Kingella denitrificans ATCC 33394]QQB42631.1 hypothetical protein I6I17_03600 [Kingella denitrificans]STR11417.1 Uncharacterised protein [Kingella denitrificans]